MRAWGRPYITLRPVSQARLASDEAVRPRHRFAPLTWATQAWALSPWRAHLAVPRAGPLGAHLFNSMTDMPAPQRLAYCAILQACGALWAKQVRRSDLPALQQSVVA